MKYGAMNFPIKPVADELADIAALGFDYLELSMDPPQAHYSTIRQQMNSILSALALTDVFWVMASAIVVGGLLMIFLADRVSAFLQKNRMYEVLGLFILFVVGIMLLTEGGHLAHLSLFGHQIRAMNKATFYFVITVLVLTDLVQTRYQKKLMRMKGFS